MSEIFIMDTGPLVALLDRRDPDHRWARSAMDRLTGTVLTCEPVLTEACFLLARGRIDPTCILRCVRDSTLQPALEIRDEAPALETLMARYADVPMSLADACLVRLSELHEHCRVLTLDRHFKTYRRFGRSVIPVLSPFA